MSGGQLPRYFKLWMVVFLFTIVFLIYSRQILPGVANNVSNVDTRAHFLKLVNERIAWLNKSKSSKHSNFQINFGLEEYDEAILVDESQLPIDDDMPAAYLKYAEPAPVNQSYCKLNYKLPYDLTPRREIPPEGNKSSRYRVQYNVVEAHDIKDVPQVTYASHVTADFAYYIPELLKRWDGLISVGAFVPDLDIAMFLEQIIQYCYCEPEMRRVSIHLILDQQLPASRKDVYFERPETCNPQDSSKIQIYSNFDDSVTYPINVCRNAARKAALTKYILVSDIQLMPSKDLATGFLHMLEQYKTKNTNEVFVLPIFEVAENEVIPETKEGLINLILNNRAVYFHGLICNHCQNFPGIDQWMSDYSDSEIKAFLTVKRHSPYHRWEPLFIGTNAEPWYNEQLVWEGLQDKMPHSLEMCLLDYNFTILDNAFLIHWPGIRTEKLKNEEWRLPFVKNNEAIYNTTIQLLQEKYTVIEECLVNSTMNLLYKKSTKRPKI